MPDLAPARRSTPGRGIERAGERSMARQGETCKLGLHNKNSVTTTTGLSSRVVLDENTAHRVSTVRVWTVHGSRRTSNVGRDPRPREKEIADLAPFGLQ